MSSVTVVVTYLRLSYSLKSLKQNKITGGAYCLNIFKDIYINILRIPYWNPSKVPPDLVHMFTIKRFDKAKAYMASVFSKF